MHTEVRQNLDRTLIRKVQMIPMKQATETACARKVQYLREPVIIIRMKAPPEREAPPEAALEH